MAYQRKDFYYRKAKHEGYRSRAAYKLMELDERLRLFSPGQKVLDLGCAPGGWLQVAAQKVGPRGRVTGVDRLPCPPLGLAQVNVLQGDLTEQQTLERLRAAVDGPVDVVLSDMAPDTSGVGFADHFGSVALVELAARLAVEFLRPGGLMVAKVFEGPETAALIKKLQADFVQVKRLHLKSTRAGSREIYLVARR